MLHEMWVDAYAEEFADRLLECEVESEEDLETALDLAARHFRFRKSVREAKVTND